MENSLNIPKTIHFTWFSNDPYPELVRKCMESWRKIMPDYEFIHWDLQKISNIDSTFLRQALENRKWAFAADLVRVYALYNFGGIYLDTDVEVYKPFDSLLCNKAFIGRESSYHLDGRRTAHYLTSHCMGGIKGHPFFKACFEYYHGRDFVLSNESWLPPELKFDQTILPFIQYEIAKIQGYRPSCKIRKVQTLENGLYVYPSHYFDCYHKIKDAYCRHLALGGWRDNVGDRHGLKDTLKSRTFASVHKAFEIAGFSIFKNL